MREVKITVDTREPDRYYNFLDQAFPNMEVVKGTLKEGDYESKKVLVERKTLPDLYGSLIGSKGKPGRLWRQMDRLATHDDKVVGVLITGDMGETYEAMKELEIDFNPDLLYGTIGRIVSSYNFQVMWIANEWSALIAMGKFMKQCDEGKFGIPMRRDPDVLAARLLKVTTYQWADLKKKFGTLENIGNASLKELQSVYRIGPARAKFIKKCIRERL